MDEQPTVNKRSGNLGWGENYPHMGQSFSQGRQARRHRDWQAYKPHTRAPHVYVEEVAAAVQVRLAREGREHQSIHSSFNTDSLQ